MPSPVPNNSPTPIGEALRELRSIIETEGSFSTRAYEFAMTLAERGEVGIDDDLIQRLRADPELLDTLLDRIDNDPVVE